MKRHLNAANELPAPFQGLDLAATAFRLVLVINGHRKEWLPPLQEALRRELHAIVQSWALGANAVAVINHETAMNLALISSPYTGNHRT